MLIAMNLNILEVNQNLHLRKIAIADSKSKAVTHISKSKKTLISSDGYYVAYKPILLPCISFIFIKIYLFIRYSCVMFVMKSMSICND